MSTTTRAMTTAELLILASVAVGELTEEHPGLTVRVGVLGNGHGRPYIELLLSDAAPITARRRFLADAGRAFGRHIEPSLGSAVVRLHDWQGTGVYLECCTPVDLDTLRTGKDC